MTFIPIYRNEPDIYNLDGFTPRMVGQADLSALGVTVVPDEATMALFQAGCRSFMERYKARTAIPRLDAELCDIDPDSELEIHNYTSRCPTLTYEISPVQGCQVGCLYCLVTDGVHEDRLRAYRNYAALLAPILEKNRHGEHYYYYSAKTEALQEPTLQTGIAHAILRTFIRHFEAYPDSKARLFIASKAGIRHLMVERDGERIIDLFEQLKGKMQFNTSISIMPDCLRPLLEPYAASIPERMAAVQLCQEKGILANSALVQPIFPSYLTEAVMRRFFETLQRNGIINFKPEFLTVSPDNLAWIGQLLAHFDPDQARRLYTLYLAPENQDHRKQRQRTAPERAFCLERFSRLREIGRNYGISMSICYWVRQELNIDADMIPIVNENGYQCLGYQRRLFDDSQAAWNGDPRP
jgi:DNA repair photolyase